MTERSRLFISRLDFTAAPGSIVWITGENGAGKTTLLRGLSRMCDPLETAYFTPSMNVPSNTTAAAWLRFSERIESSSEALSPTDALLPRVNARARLTKVSTGEAKRFLLWTLLRRQRTFTLLDEPYEHLSPAAKARLTEILVIRSTAGIVVVATNQEVPALDNTVVLEMQ